ncbi:MAG: rod shape-determining protein RodA, partial [Pseudomonadota bacterium]
MSQKLYFPEEELSIKAKFERMSKSLLLFASIVVCIGTVMLYSSAGGQLVPWAGAHFIRYCVALIICLAITMVPIRWIYKPAYLIHIITILLLIATALFGDTSKGAERWLNLGIVRLQPSELAKISTIVALGRFFHEGYKFRFAPIYMVSVPMLIIVIPTILILKQPDLGTSLLLIFAGITVMFCAGLDWRLFAGGGIAALSALPFIWLGMKPYQKRRVLTFLDPESDPLGAGYHIAQAKIAMGSGGITGRGFMNGPQSMLEFLPEKHTDFAFTAYAEQFGFIGSLILLSLFAVIIFIMIMMAVRTRHIFGKLLIIGLTTNFFFYVFINMAMVMGLIPVVGVPLPLMSYGGTVMISIFIAFGIA